MSHRRSVVPLLIVVVLALAGWGCSAPEVSAEDETPATVTGLTAGRHVFMTTDGLELPYVVSGNDGPTIMLVHCWMCDRSFFDAQVPVLQETYRVIALDLPGHGEGGDGRAAWTIDGYGRDVAGLLEELDLSDVILVGHSMGGPVSLRAAALAKGRVRGIVAVDTLHDAEFDFDAPQMKQVVEMFQADFRNICNTMVGQMFVEEGVDEVQEQVRRIGCQESNEEAGKALMADFGTLDMPALFREAGVPIRAINATAPNPTKIETNRKYADFDAVFMENVGHYLQMTRPEEFNRLLLETLENMPAAVEDS